VIERIAAETFVVRTKSAIVLSRLVDATHNPSVPEVRNESPSTG
jgi:hypothetical protein